MISKPSALKMMEMFPSYITRTEANELKYLMGRGDINEFMYLANKELKGYGVKSIRDENVWVGPYWQNTIAIYINMGDTYDTTFLYDTEKDRLYITSYGDWYENRSSKVKVRGELKEPKKPRKLKYANFWNVDSIGY